MVLGDGAAGELLVKEVQKGIIVLEVAIFDFSDGNSVMSLHRLNQLFEGEQIGAAVSLFQLVEPAICSVFCMPEDVEHETNFFKIFRLDEKKRKAKDQYVTIGADVSSRLWKPQQGVLFLPKSLERSPMAYRLVFFLRFRFGFSCSPCSSLNLPTSLIAESLIDGSFAP